MSEKTDNKALIPLAKMLGQLRDELLEAQAQGEGKDLRFLINDIEIELQVATTQEGTGGAGIKFWVVNADAKLRDAEVTTQKVKLKLAAVDREGNRVVKIASADTQRPD
jgi:hypothetical protein